MSAVKKKKKNGYKIFYIILFIVIAVALTLTVFLLPDNNGNKQGKDTELEETYDTQNFDDTKAPAQTEASTDTARANEGLDPLPETLVPASYTEDKIEESDQNKTLTVIKPVFSSDEYGENAARLNELIELKCGEIVNEYAKADGNVENKTEYGFAYEMHYNDKGIVSILYHTYIKAGEDPQRTYGSINYDMNAGNTVSVVNVCAEGVTDHHTKIADKIVEAVSAEPDKYTVTDEAMIRELYNGAQTQFITDQTNITVYFQPGAVADAANGITLFVIPVDSIK